MAGTQSLSENLIADQKIEQSQPWDVVLPENINWFKRTKHLDSFVSEKNQKIEVFEIEREIRVAHLMMEELVKLRAQRGDAKAVNQFPLFANIKYQFIASLQKDFAPGEQNKVKLHQFLKAIDDSAFIKDLADDWDDEGAAKVSPELYNIAIEFLTKTIIVLLKRYRVVIASPTIEAVPDGTLDMSWDVNGNRLVINIKKKDKTYVAYFLADQADRASLLKGFVPAITPDETLATWMKDNLLTN